MRTDDDQWTITESVGVTALGVASGRAMETRRDDGLVDDPYAASFVDAVRGELDLPTRADPDADPTDPSSGPHSTYVGVRSRWFDDALLAAAADGTDQVVILASGLDTRAQRLDWPAGTTVYELDQDAVLDFKAGVLARDGADANPHAIRVDLRDDWPAALRRDGFDPTRPAVWLAEGLLPYLPGAAEVALFDRIAELSAPGSRIVVEHLAGAVEHMSDDDLTASMSQRFGIDVRELFFDDERPDPRARLRAAGWTVAQTPAAEAAEGFGRALEGPMARVFGGAVFFTATLPSGTRHPSSG